MRRFALTSLSALSLPGALAVEFTSDCQCGAAAAETEESEVLTQDQSEFVERLMAAANSGNAETWAACYADDVANHGRAAGRTGMLRILGALYTIFPDWHFEPSEVLADGDDIVVLLTMTGTHLGTSDVPVLGGSLVGVPPTGRAVRVEHIHRYRVRDGVVVDHRAVRDDLGLMQQLGLVAGTNSAEDVSRPKR